MWWQKSEVKFDMCGETQHAHFYLDGERLPGRVKSKNQARLVVDNFVADNLVSKRRADHLRRQIEATDLPEKSDAEIEREKPARFEVATLDKTPFALLPHGYLVGPKAKPIGTAFSQVAARQLLTDAISGGDIPETDRDRIQAEIAAAGIPEDVAQVDTLLEIAREQRKRRAARQTSPDLCDDLLGMVVLRIHSE